MKDTKPATGGTLAIPFGKEDCALSRDLKAFQYNSKMPLLVSEQFAPLT